MSSVGEEKNHFLYPLWFSSWGPANESDKRQMNKRKSIRVLFDVNFYATWSPFEKEVKTPKKQAGLRAHIPFLTKSDKSWRHDKTKESILKTSRGCKLWKSKHMG